MRGRILALAAAAALLTAGPGGAAPAEPVPLTVSNMSGQSLVRLHVAPVRRAALFARRGDGPDILGAEVVADGETATLAVERTRSCRFDVAAVMADGSYDRRPDVDLCREGALRFGPRVRDPAAPRAPGTLWVVNDTPDDLLYLWVWDEGAAIDESQPANDAVQYSRETRSYLAGTEWSCEVHVRMRFSGSTGMKEREVDLCTDPYLHVLYPPEAMGPDRPRPERPRGLPFCPGDPRCKKKK